MMTTYLVTRKYKDEQNYTPVCSFLNLIDADKYIADSPEKDYKILGIELFKNYEETIS